MSKYKNYGKNLSALAISANLLLHLFFYSSLFAFLLPIFLITSNIGSTKIYTIIAKDSLLQSIPMYSPTKITQIIKSITSDERTLELPMTN
ncbi:hypothetical protein [Rickettsia endosymbiont of Urophora cardui]|uniref:hypothetical protein n=1 Tax=Rickettsia endosymbiont of Urophora cardui TaxID=3066265 RepID=UPI00313C7C6D